MSDINEFLDGKTPEGKTGEIDAFLDKPAGPVRQLADAALSLGKGIIAVPQAAVGVADLVTGGKAGKLVEDAGIRFKDAQEALDEWQSPELAMRREKFKNADGILDKVGVALANPSLIANTVVESLPLMGAGGAVGAKALQVGAKALAPGVAGPALPGVLARTFGHAAPVVAGAAGEGLVGAGSAAESIRSETPDGELTGKQAALSGAIGAATMGFGVGGGRIAKHFGVGDPDAMLAAGTRNVLDPAGVTRISANTTVTQTPKGVFRRIAEGGTVEGFLEELPQSLADQALQNIALGKPVDEGLIDAGVMGTLAGNVMGGVAGGFARPTPTTAPVAAPAPGPVTQALLAGSITGTAPSALMGAPGGNNAQLLNAARTPPAAPPAAPTGPAGSVTGTNPADLLGNPAANPAAFPPAQPGMSAPDTEPPAGPVTRALQMAAQPTGTLVAGPDGVLTPETGLDVINRQQTLNQEREKREARNAQNQELGHPDFETEDGSITNQGWPFKGRVAAAGAAQRAGSGYKVVKVDDGFVARKANWIANDVTDVEPKKPQSAPANASVVPQNDPLVSPADASVPQDIDAAPGGAPQGLTRAAAIDSGPAVVLQNRDRSSAASIAQMNDIAARPDYLRAGQANVMETGAPVAFGDLPPTAKVGQRREIADGKGDRVSVQYAVVEASDLLASHRADGTAVPEYTEGQPGKLRTVAGNGRAAGIAEGYVRGTAEQYRKDLTADAASLGLNPAAIRSMTAPVLVRVMDAKDVKPDIADRSNIAGSAKLSPAEQAATDARRVDLTALEFDEQGEPTAKAVAQFTAGMPVAERGELINPDGSATRQAIDRLMAATFKQAYGSDELVRLYAQATDTEARTIMSALADAAGAMAGLKDAGELDIRGAVAEAAGLAINAKRRGIKLAELLKNADIEVSGEALVVAQFMADNIRSAKRIAEGLRAWAGYAQEQAAIAQGNEVQGGMFGAAPVASRSDVFRRLGDGQEPGEAGEGAGQPRGPGPAPDGAGGAQDNAGPGQAGPAVGPPEASQEGITPTGAGGNANAEQGATPAPGQRETPPEANPVNGRPRAADVKPEESLLLMPCSGPKDFKGNGEHEAKDVYQGVMWQTLRTHNPDPGPQLVILSAKYGFISGDELIAPYDRMIDEAAANEILAELDEYVGRFEGNDYRDVQIVGGEQYRRVMRAFVAELQARGAISEDASIREVTGGIGEHRQQLGEYLRGFAAEPAAATPLPTGTAPEHVTTGVDDRELGEIADEFRDYQQRMVSDPERVTHIFDAPAKGEVVRLADKAKVYQKDHGWMTVKEAKAKIAEWKASAAAQGKTSANADKVVLSLFDLTGSWSKPWADAGYMVVRFDIQDDPELGDVTKFDTQYFVDNYGDFEGNDVYAILAANPCTDFAVSGARHFAAKDADGRTIASVKLVHHTLATIEYFKPAVWAIENPVGRIEKLGGLPPWRLSFDPNHLGDPYTKKTLIWGRFNGDLPIAPVEPVEGSKMHSQYGGSSQATKNARSQTPEGFAYGFFAANNALDNPVMAVANKYDRLDRDLIGQALDAGITPEEIDRLVEDPYYQDLDDPAAEQALRDAIAEAKPAPLDAQAILAKFPVGTRVREIVSSHRGVKDHIGTVTEASAAGLTITYDGHTKQTPDQLHTPLANVARWVDLLDESAKPAAAPAPAGRPANWRSNFIGASKVAKDLGIPFVKGRKLADLVALIDAQDKGAAKSIVAEADALGEEFGMQPQAAPSERMGSKKAGKGYGSWTIEQGNTKVSISAGSPGQPTEKIQLLRVTKGSKDGGIESINRDPAAARAVLQEWLKPQAAVDPQAALDAEAKKEARSPEARALAAKMKERDAHLSVGQGRFNSLAGAKVLVKEAVQFGKDGDYNITMDGKAAGVFNMTRAGAVSNIRLNDGFGTEDTREAITFFADVHSRAYPPLPSAMADLDAAIGDLGNLFGADNQGAPTGAQWIRTPTLGNWADYDLLHAGELFIRVSHAGHPTALRPYYLRGPGVPDGSDESMRKFSQLADAKAAAMRLYEQRDKKPAAAPAAPSAPAQWPELAALVDRVENEFGYDERDLKIDVDTMIDDGLAPKSLRAAVDAFDQEIEDDRDMGGRGDLDSAAEAFVAAVKAVLPKPAEVAKPAEQVAKPAAEVPAAPVRVQGQEPEFSPLDVIMAITDNNAAKTKAKDPQLAAAMVKAGLMGDKEPTAAAWTFMERLNQRTAADGQKMVTEKLGKRPFDAPAKPAKQTLTLEVAAPADYALGDKATITPEQLAATRAKLPKGFQLKVNYAPPGAPYPSMALAAPDFALIKGGIPQSLDGLAQAEQLASAEAADPHVTPEFKKGDRVEWTSFGQTDVGTIEDITPMDAAKGTAARATIVSDSGIARSSQQLRDLRYSARPSTAKDQSGPSHKEKQDNARYAAQARLERLAERADKDGLTRLANRLRHLKVGPAAVDDIVSRYDKLAERARANPEETFLGLQPAPPMSADAKRARLADLERAAKQAARERFDKEHGGVGSLTAQKILKTKAGKALLASYEAEEMDLRKGQTAKAQRTPSADTLRAQADLNNAMADLGDLLGKPGRMNIVPEDEAKLLPVLSRVLDAAFRLGYHKFKDAAKFALDTIREKLGAEFADALSLEHLQGAYIAMSGGKMEADKIGAVGRVETKGEIETHTAVNQNDQEASDDDVPSSDSNLESDRGEPAAQPAVGAPVPDEPGRAGQRPGDASQGAGVAGGGQPDNPRLPAGGPTFVGVGGDQRFPGGGEPAGPAGGPPGDLFGERSGDSGIAGVPPDAIPAATVAAAARGNAEPAKRRDQRAANLVAIAPGLENIRATLPYLLEGQQEDVFKAETRYAKPNGYGILFTNGTGTGKTFLGLGTAKRFERQGKGNILIVVPDEKIGDDWIEAGKPLELSITRLADTKSAGEGVVITTYANLGQNDELARRNWDLIIPDEAHTLMQAKDGEPTLYLDRLRAISHHPDAAHIRHAMLHRELLNTLAALETEIREDGKERSKSDTTDMRRAQLQKQIDANEKKAAPLRKEVADTQEQVAADVAAKQGAPRARLLALTATPFAYEKTIDWGNGYLFDYKEGYPYDETSLGYNEPTPREYFFITHLGYRKRYGKLTEPDAKVDRGLMQRQFNGWLKKQGVLSGRMLDVPFDYDRRFILIDSAIGNQIDAALDWLSDKSYGQDKIPGMSAVRDMVSDTFDYLSRRYLLEAIKAQEVVPIVKQHLALGRKVVVFHDYNKGGGFNPFDVQPQPMPKPLPGGQADPKLTEKTEAINGAIAQFRAQFAELVAMPFSRMRSPIETFRREFGDELLLINGLENKAAVLRRYTRFQDDGSGPLVALVQADKNRGWSGHDTTGKHKRILINLGQPTQPTRSIQQEGRIYRTGQASNAAFRYMSTGTSWERIAFATTIASRSGTAENLGMGELARALKDAFIAAYEEADRFPPGHEGEGTGGKERDAAVNNALTEYDRARAFYFGTQKKTSKTKAQEGKDYYATPEPVGLKMVQWASVLGGEDLLEPSGGHGAIARWFHPQANRTAIEPSSALRSRLALVYDGKIVEGTFEDHNIVNKYDGIVMNPPFGVGGKTAMDHLAKAATHLRDGGRIVALIPRGPAADKRLEQFLYEEKPTQAMHRHALGAIHKGDRLTFDDGKRMEAGDTTALGPATFIMPLGSTDVRDARNLLHLAAIEKGPRTESQSSGLYLIADIVLPQATFERAGTQVATHIIVLQKGKDTPQQINRDYSDIDDINALFDKLEHLDLKPRPEKAVPAFTPSTPQALAPSAPQARPGAAPTPSGPPVDDGDFITVTTSKGKQLRGVIRNITLAQAKAIDPHTWQAKDWSSGRAMPYKDKNGNDLVGYFLRAKYLQGGTTAQEERAVYRVNDPQASYDIDLFPATLDDLQDGVQVPKTRKAGRATTPTTEQPLAIARPVLAVRQDPALPGVYHVSSQLVEVGTKMLPVDRVIDWDSAAEALSSLSGFAVEHFDMLITDASGKPLAIVGSFKGAPTQTSIYPGTVIMEALRIEGAAHAWAVHNHPSGNPQLSRADEALSLTLGHLFFPSTIEYHGIAAVAKQPGGQINWRAVDEDERPYQGSFTPRPAVHAVPIVERLITTGAELEMMTSPTVAMARAGTLARGSQGLMLMNSQNQITGWIPEQIETLAKATKESYDRLINSFGQAAASGVIAVLPENSIGSSAIGAAMRKLKERLALVDVRVLDGVEPVGRVSMAEKGLMEPEPEGDLLSGYDRQEAIDKQKREEAAREAEEKAKNAKGQPGKKVTGDQVDLFNPQGGLFSRSNPFFSALSRELGAINAKAQPAMGWKAQILGLVKAGKVKADEVEWTGINEWLTIQQGKIAKEAVLAYLDANGVRVTEVQKGGRGPVDPIGELDDLVVRADALGYSFDRHSFTEGGDYFTRQVIFTRRSDEAIFEFRPGANGWQEIDSDGVVSGEAALPDGEITAIATDISQLAQDESEGNDADGTRYGNYTLPGGENYREVLLTLPERVSPEDKARIEANHNRAVELRKEYNALLQGGLGDMQGDEAELGRNLRNLETRIKMLTKEGDALKNQGYHSSHWDEKNILAHIRLNERTDADGKKVLFVEEIQSDWAQAGRREGFGQKPPRYSVRDANGHMRGDFATQAEGQAYIDNPPENMRFLIDHTARVVEAKGTREGIPNAPFVGKTDAWVTLALKRIVKMAVDEGFDRVALVTGAQSAERYSLSKVVKKVSWGSHNDTAYITLHGLTGVSNQALEISADKRTGIIGTMDFGAPANWAGKPLADVIGKDLAEKILASTEDNEVSGEGLKVGGEGMISFYDKIVPAAVNTLLKKLGGGKMGEVTMNMSPTVDKSHKEYGYEDRLPKQRFTQPGFDITPAMKEAAADGLAQFRRDTPSQTAADDAVSARGMTRTAFSQALAKAFGSQVAGALERGGVVVPVADQRSLPTHVVPFLRSGDIVYGFYDPTTDRTYAVLSNLKPEMVRGLVLHEVGVHFGFEDMLGRQKYIQVINRIKALGKLGHAQVLQAQAQATKNASAPRQIPEETLAYLVQNHPELGFIRSVIAQIRAFLFDKFGILGDTLTTEDIAALAKAAVLHASRTQAGTRRPDFARGQPDLPSMSADALRTVQVDGVRRPAENSMGQLIHPTFLGQVNAWRWAKDTKVVDDKGRLLVVYHGTTKDFAKFQSHERYPAKKLYIDGKLAPRADSWDMGEDRKGMPEGIHYGAWTDALTMGAEQALEFRAEEGRRYSDSPDTQRHLADLRRLIGAKLEWRDEAHPTGDGFYFSPSPTYSTAFSGREELREGGNLMPVYLSIKNPIYLDAGGIEVAGLAHNVAKYKAQGYDGAIFVENNMFGTGRLPLEQERGSYSAQIVAFSPEQIKSATGNNGGFDPADGNIMFSRAVNDLNPSQEAALRNVGGIPPTQTMSSRWASLRANLGTRLRTGLVDQFAPMLKLSQRAYLTARMSKGGDGTMEAAMLYGKPFLRGDVPDVDIRDGGFAAVLATLKGEHDRFLWWVAATRAERLKTEGRENLFSDTDISDLKTLNTGNFADGTARAAVYQAAADKLLEFNASVLKMALDSGLITQDAFDVMKTQPYVPFYRLMDDAEGPRFSARGGLVNQSAYKQLKGGTAQLNNDLLQNMLLNWSHLFTASARNRAAVVAMDDALNLAIAYPAPYGAKKAVTIKRNGLSEAYIIEDPYLMEAVSALHYVPSELLKPLAAMKHILTLGVTANPAFKIRNLIRDSLSAIGTSELGYNPIANIAQGWKATGKHSQVFASMLAAGGVMRFGATEDTNRVRRQIEGLGGTLLDKKGFDKLSGQVAAVWNAYQELGDRGENVNRAALYQQLIASGHSHAEASFMARDLMDFSMSGQWGAIRFLAQTVPFFNARLQGLYKLGRAAADDPRKFAVVAGAVSLASLGLMLAYGDDDDWKKREDWDRDTNWWFKIGDTAFRIPKPFEIGAIGTLAERTAEYMINPEMTGKRMRARLSNMVFQTFSFDPTPQIVKPLVDIYANKDSFTGRSIESLSDARLRPQDRIGERTSEVARLLGSLGLPDPAQLAKGEYAALSPKQIDFLFRGYFGWLGTAALTVSDYSIRPMTDRGARPSMQLRDTFLAGNFVETLPSGSSRYVTAFYDQAKAIEQAYGSYQAALKRGDLEEARSIMDSEGAKIRAFRAVEHIKRAESQANAQARRVEASRTLSAEEKRAQLQELAARRDALARQVPLPQ